MNYFHWIAGSILALVWVSRILEAAWGMRKVADISRPEWVSPFHAPGSAPRVSIIVPARNEAEMIEQALTQLLRLDYPNYEIIAVDDRSTDATGEIMDRVAKVASTGLLKVVHVAELPAGWLGKAHSMWTAGKTATGDWLLFTDADVLFRPSVVRRAMAYALKENADHVVLFPSMIMHSVGERMMIAFFQSLFVFGHRPWRVANPKTEDHMGVGAFNLLRKSTYEAVGTYQTLRFDVLDDMKLGKIVKNAGFAQRNVFGGDLISIRWAHGAMGVVRNLTKNFFAIVSFQWPRALISAAGLAFLNLMPFIGICVARGWPRLPYAVALLAMFAIYVGMARLSDVSPWYLVLHPVATTLFVYTMLLSMIVTLAQQGVVWRGTKYPLDELRKGMA